MKKLCDIFLEIYRNCYAPLGVSFVDLKIRPNIFDGNGSSVPLSSAFYATLFYFNWLPRILDLFVRRN